MQANSVLLLERSFQNILFQKDQYLYSRTKHNLL